MWEGKNGIRFLADWNFWSHSRSPWMDGEPSENRESPERAEKSWIRQLPTATGQTSFILCVLWMRHVVLAFFTTAVSTSFSIDFSSTESRNEWNGMPTRRAAEQGRSTRIIYLIQGCRYVRYERSSGGGAISILPIIIQVGGFYLVNGKVDYSWNLADFSTLWIQNPLANLKIELFSQ